MELKELRIGNYINGLYETDVDRGNGVIENVEVVEAVRVVCIDSVGVTEYPIWIENGSREEYDSFEPITLTDEWFVNFGFRKWEANVNMGIAGQPKSGYVKNSFVINYNPNKGYTYDKNLKPDTVYFNHVHKLQNLYLELEQKELTLKK